MKERLMRRKAPRRALLMFALVLAALVFAPGRAALAEPVTAGDYSVDGGDWSYDANQHLLTILTGTEVTISMADGVEQTASDRIAVADGVDANVTLDGVNADFTDINASKSSYNILTIGSPASPTSGGTRLTLAAGSVNRLRTTMSDAISVGNKGTLTIGGTGELDVESTDYSSYHYPNGSGIGANYGGFIVIEGGTINARAQGAGAAIGSSQGYLGGIRISGGDVTATTDSDFYTSGNSYNASAIGNGGYFAGSNPQYGDIVIEGGTVSAKAGGSQSGAAIGYYPAYYGGSFTPGDVSITGGYITAASNGLPATPILDAGGKLSITGGFFGAGTLSVTPGDDGDRGAVYGAEPDPGYTVIADEEPDSKAAYPVRVLKNDPYDLSAAQDGPAVYDAGALDPEAIALGARADVAVDPAELTDHATFRHRSQGTGGPWTDGLPEDAGAYEVEVTERPFADGTGKLALIPRGAAIAEVTIDRRPLEVASASAAPKAYDGKTDASVSGVEFTGLVGGEHLWPGEDYEATGSFADAEPGQDKNVVVTVSLRQDGPRSRNYILSEGHASANATAGILGDGHDGHDGRDGKDGRDGRDGNGHDGRDGRDGKNGAGTIGQKGENGKNGTSASGARGDAVARKGDAKVRGSKMPSTGDAAWIAGGASTALLVAGSCFIVLSRGKALRCK
ncbi:hypothetical protein Corgl_1105 [Coriobacterium glomerans PW2]|uniref:YDG domain-containing protein n=1 Tax=Coriobacterium glomerans (strain ATCC 49209 / DSM 20642 / JCM 10262 / PW2) TaxID=700015 RepID=F2N829_CORGP|nr:YDG domain-containing protein [Coriobacterium glomerans]AEB07212.1 hypothetical protein Corgl_1105 [Coriobacterium glomerans PW2]